MSYKITFNPDGTWIGRGKFTYTLKDINDIYNWIKSFFSEFGEIGDKYGEFLGNDGVLLGQEKVNLVNELDDVLGGLILFRAYINDELKGTIVSAESKYNYSFCFRLDQVGWEGSGKIENKYVFNIINFSEWYNKMIAKLREVFTNYLNNLKDGLLDDTEKGNLIQLIEFIIFDMIVIERKLVTTEINK